MTLPTSSATVQGASRRASDGGLQQRHTQTVVRKSVTVASVDNATLRAIVTWADGTNSDEGFPWLTSYMPRTGDVALLDSVLNSPVLVGKVSSVMSPTQQADVTTAQTTTSTSYTDLATVGPTITGVFMSVGESILVNVSCKSNNASGTGHAAAMSFAVSGVETIAAADVDSCENDNSVTASVSRWTVFTAAVEGLHTFTSKYRTVTSGTSTFVNRRLIVVQFG